MRVAFLLNRFPALSETFILNQIVGLLQLGHEVDIHAKPSAAENDVHPAIDALGLMAQVRPPVEFPSNVVKAISRVSSIFMSRTEERSVLIRSLSPRRRAGRVSTMGLYSRAIPVRMHGDYDVLHCHYGPNGNLGVSLKRIGAFSGPLVTTFYGYDVSSYVATHGAKVYKELFCSGDLFLAVSNRMRLRLIEMGCPARKIVVHRLGIDLCRFKRDTRLQRSPRVGVVSLARLTEKKGLEYGIRAIAKLRDRGVSLDYRIVGDGALRSKLEMLIKELGISDQVRLLGWRSQPDVVRMLQQSDIFLAPSVTARDGDEEGLPVAISEAMAHGLPVVASMHAGIPELVDDGETGYLVPEADVDAIASRLSDLASSESLRRTLGTGARDKVARDYDITQLSGRLTKLYISLRN